MKLIYNLKIENPQNHLAQISIKGERPSGTQSLDLFLPSWSPGSYLMREYSRHVQRFTATTSRGEILFFEQIKKGVWRLDWSRSELKHDDHHFEVRYETYCHEISVRTSYIDESHAFLHGPTLFMGVVGEQMNDPELTLNFPASWSKVSTGLKDISPSREVFRYSAPNYDLLIDTPIEIGCHETDGFMCQGKPHELAFYGELLPHKENLKKDIQTIVETVSSTMKSMPYDKYTFITHFIPGIYGGLEHSNSTALHFDSAKLSERKGYVQWLELVAHEYFHTWNVKRIRPVELGPFDYLNEGYTRMHWLTEGLTSFMDQLLVLRAGLMSMSEYADAQKDNLVRYYDTPGKKFHSLEDSSFNAWIKLYRPDENSLNSSISYYLKGGLVFTALHSLLVEKGVKIDDLLAKLWRRYEDIPERGMVDNEVYAMIDEIAGTEVRDEFVRMITTTEDIDFEKVFARLGLALEWENPEGAYLGARIKTEGERLIVDQVLIDSPAAKSGLNAGDELIALNGQRLLKGLWDQLPKVAQIDQGYDLTISRLGRLSALKLFFGKTPKKLKALKVVDEAMAVRTLLA